MSDKKRSVPDDASEQEEKVARTVEPESAMPASESTVPESAMPASESTVPASESTMPASESTMPASESTMPASAVPASAVPESAMPASAVPASAVPESAMPACAASESAASESAASDDEVEVLKVVPASPDEPNFLKVRKGLPEVRAHRPDVVQDWKRGSMGTCLVCRDRRFCCVMPFDCTVDNCVVGRGGAICVDCAPQVETRVPQCPVCRGPSRLWVV
jgi:hypothetical protein